MATVGTYLNFAGQTEEAFLFYQSVFGGEFDGGISRFGEVPEQSDAPSIGEDEKNLVMHVTLPILNGHLLMGSDVPRSFGRVEMGNSVYISLNPDTRAECDRLFAALSEGGVVEMPLQDMFWGDYYGSFTDKFGIHWVINCAEPAFQAA